MKTQKYINDLSFTVVGCAIEVHKQVGPGLLESVYHACLSDELENNNIEAKSQIFVPILNKGKDLGGKLKLDILIENLIIVELKAVDTMIPLYSAQLLSYLRLAHKPKGLLINFHTENIISQMVPLVTDEFAKLPRY